jgi:hypothetical protein
MQKGIRIVKHDRLKYLPPTLEEHPSYGVITAGRSIPFRIADFDLAGFEDNAFDAEE